MKGTFPTAAKAEFVEALAVLARKWRTRFDAEVKGLGLTAGRSRVLLELRGQKEPLTQIELADTLDIEGPTLVRLLDALEKQGFVERLSRRHDRRARWIHLTADGIQISERLKDVSDHIRYSVLGHIADEELANAVKVFRSITRKLDESSRVVAGVADPVSA